MKKQIWTLGIGISIGLTLIGISFRMMQSQILDLTQALEGLVYSFLYCIFIWRLLYFLFTKQLEFGQRINPILFALFNILGSASTLLIYNQIFMLADYNHEFYPDINGFTKYLNPYLRGVLISGLYYFIFYYLHVFEERQRSFLEIEHLKQAQLEANISSLQEQLSPHFLFNTLNTLSSLTHDKTVKTYVSELANVYRYVLMLKKMNTVTLQQEMNFIESYLYIIKTRMEDAIEINITVDEHLLKTLIPPLTFQLLLENAIKHNVASRSRHLKINIYNQSDDFLVISNNFQPKNTNIFSTGIGLNNVMQRYNLLFKQDIIIEKNTESFLVKLPIVIA